MQPGKTSVTNLFSTPAQYLIPVFQRGYVWTLEKQVVPLWADILDRANKWLEHRANAQQIGVQPLRPIQKHFLGSVVLTPIPPAFGRVMAYEVIDGQQRTTTLHLLMLAFQHAAQNLQQPEVVAMLAGLVRNPGPYAQVNDHFKVWPTEAGRTEIKFLNSELDAQNICARYPVKQDRQKMVRPLMVEAYLYLHHACLAFLRDVDIDDPVRLSSDGTHSDALVRAIRHDNVITGILPGRPLLPERAEALYMTLQELVQIMTLTLEPEDDPQVIFETLNARGEPLLASDLVRNFVFLDAARRGLAVSELYARHWSRFDQQTDAQQTVAANRYWREKVRQGRLAHPRIELFFFHYTVLRRQEETKFSHIFQSFKDWWQSADRVIDDELANLVQASQYFQELISPQGNGDVAEFARLIGALDVSTLTPLYLVLRKRLVADSPALKQSLGDLASYVTRRAVCGLTTKSYNKVFLKLMSKVAVADDPAATLRAELLRLGGDSQRWPDDDAFREHWLNRPVYLEIRAAKVCAVLRALERSARTCQQETHAVPLQSGLTVEHVMPQSWASTDVLSWYPLADDTELIRRDRARRVHTFGNLTLLTQALNSSVSNGSFQDRQVQQGDGLVVVAGKRTGFLGSLLIMNSYFQKPDIQTWSDADIDKRGCDLFERARQTWSYPNHVLELAATGDVRQALVVLDRLDAQDASQA